MQLAKSSQDDKLQIWRNTNKLTNQMSATVIVILPNETPCRTGTLYRLVEKCS